MSRPRHYGKSPGRQRRYSENATVEHRPPPPAPVPPLVFNLKELENALKVIQSVVQCHSCHKPLETASTCLKGHGICHNCRSQCNRTCPVCHTMVLDAKPIMLNEIIKLLPKPCSFSAKGCEHLILPKDTDHERFCRLRQTSCRYKSCDWKGMAKELLYHLERVHGKEMLCVPTQTSILVAFNTQTDREGLGVILAFNNIFWQHIRVVKGKVMHVYQYIPMERPNKRFSVYITFHTPEASYSRTVPVHLDSIDVDKLFKDKSTFCLPKKTAEIFSKSCGVKYTFEIKCVNLSVL